jgi:hypothetical protein
MMMKRRRSEWYAEIEDDFRWRTGCDAFPLHKHTNQNRKKKQKRMQSKE